MTRPDPRKPAQRHRQPAGPARPRPRVLDRLRPVELDVRDDISRGTEPFARIMSAVRALADGEALALRVPFEPVPLYGVLGRQGFEHWTEHLGSGDFVVWFYREPTGSGHGPVAAPPTPAALDFRGLEPPLPMASVLERMDKLTPGETLVVLHDRRPMFLYPQLDERGFVHETDEPEPGLVRITIRRPEA
jgi:uncharacterized protein (DUF2249 family)